MIFKYINKSNKTESEEYFLKNNKTIIERKKIGRKQIPMKHRIFEVTKWI